jgi:SAM-dependent methyltransferase
MIGRVTYHKAGTILLEVNVTRYRVALLLTCISVMVLLLPTQGTGQTKPLIKPPPTKKPDVIYVPTPPFIVDVILNMAEVTPEDVVYDLGCGDGRIVVEAAKLHGARGVGIDIDPIRIRESKRNAAKNGVTDRVVFRMEDIFETDIREASVVTLYLLPTLNMRLRPKLWRDLDVGSRVVSHGYDMGDWVPDKIEVVAGHAIYLWTITEEVKQQLSSEQTPEIRD